MPAAASIGNTRTTIGVPVQASSAPPFSTWNGSNRTSIVVSHRVSTIRSAHQILVVADGRIVERGTHSQLVGAAGVYAELYQKQLLEEELASS